MSTTKSKASTRASKKVAAKKVTAKKPAARKPAAKKAAAKRPAAKRAAMKKTAAKRPAAKQSAVKKPATRTVAAKGGPAVPRTLEDFMQQALAMELEAAQRYAEFADSMEIHNNREVAEMFRKMAKIEGKHAEQIMAEMGWKEVPAIAAMPAWEGFEGPETTPSDEVHYLMQPWHVLQLALANEERAERFFARLARAATTASVRKAALELQEEEREHVELIQAWIKKVPKPERDWAVDPDPPRNDG
jgi:rubrerythrin